jgi:uncharacterized protein involved in cysteine biosynthesis
MMAETGSFDPYRSPSLPEGVYSGPPPRGRPGWLSALCVLCIVLGALGLVNSLFGTVGMVLGPRFQQFMASQPQPGLPDEIKEAQQKMQTDMYKVQAKYIWPLGISIVLRIVVCTLLLVGGIRSLGMSEQGRRLLIVACSLALGFDLLQAILQMVITVENMTVMNEFMEAMATKSQNATKEIEAVMKAVSSFIRFFSLTLVCVIALGKIAFYICSVLYLQKPHILALYQGESPPPAPALTSDL